MKLEDIYKQIIADPENAWAVEKGWQPVYTADRRAQILIIGQAPGIRAQEGCVPWNDASGNNLRDWMGVSRETFYDTAKFALVPMDFFFPGALTRGDAPPRKGFASKWHTPILAQMPHIQLTILIGQYAHAHYLGPLRKNSLTETVRCYQEYLPEYMPLVHPSPRNNIWHKKNPWFKAEVVPVLRETVAEIVG